jgi:hypothetical protein
MEQYKLLFLVNRISPICDVSSRILLFVVLFLLLLLQLIIVTYHEFDSFCHQYLLCQVTVSIRVIWYHNSLPILVNMTLQSSRLRLTLFPCYILPPLANESSSREILHEPILLTLLVVLIFWKKIVHRTDFPEIEMILRRGQLSRNRS